MNNAAPPLWPFVALGWGCVLNIPSYEKEYPFPPRGNTLAQ